jgi:hypothetical protein
MEIDSTAYSKDVLILPDGTIISPWWRRDGHRLELEDLEQLLDAGPVVIVAGTGASGLMKPAAGLAESLAGRSIELIALPTEEAVQTYNRVAGNRRTGGCFHLTC